MKLELDIHNYYEKLVVDTVDKMGLENKFDNEFLADLCCLVLTKLPARYCRHDIDMAYYLTANQRKLMQKQVTEAIDSGLAYLMAKQHQA